MDRGRRAQSVGLRRWRRRRGKWWHRTRTVADPNACSDANSDASAFAHTEPDSVAHAVTVASQRHGSRRSGHDVTERVADDGPVHDGPQLHEERAASALAQWSV